jgi:hypothetical protein
MKRFAFALTLLACASPAFAGQGNQGYDCYQQQSGRSDWSIGHFQDYNSCQRFQNEHSRRGVRCYCRVDENPGGSNWGHHGRGR